MCRCSLLLLLVSIASFADAGDADLAPMHFEVSASQVTLRCGPGDEYYETAKLPRGALVEVYRHDPGGWFGVRPPEGSFSWVPKHQLEPTSNPSVSRVVGKESVAWVGSASTQVRELRWQVRLKPGERVVVLDEEMLAAFPEAQQQLFCRISPPAGEYRWIHEDDLVPIDHQEQSQVRLTSLEADPQEASRANSNANSAPRSAVEIGEDPFAAGDAVGSLHSTNAGFALRASARNDDSWSRRPDADFDDRVRDLDLRMALAVSKSASNWELAQFTAELDELTGAAATTLQRGRCQVISERLQQYKQLQKRYAGLGDTLSAATPLDNPQPQPPLAAVSPVVDPRFDGRGWLLPVHSSHRSSPPYALLDDDGEILQFVSPAPGMNLHRYLRKEVGVFGQRGMASSLDKPHLTAHRIVDLDRHRR